MQTRVRDREEEWRVEGGGVKGWGLGRGGGGVEYSQIFGVWDELFPVFISLVHHVFAPFNCVKSLPQSSCKAE